MTLEDRKQISQTILQQLGGGMFLAMTGAKHLVCGERGELKMQLPIGTWKWVTIHLNIHDTYDVQFQGKRQFPSTRVDLEAQEIETNIYFDQLQQVFTANTGLHTKL